MPNSHATTGCDHLWYRSARRVLAAASVLAGTLVVTAIVATPASAHQSDAYAVVDTLDVNGAYGVSFDSANATAYVTDCTDDTLVPVSDSTLTTEASIPLATLNCPTYVAVDPSTQTLIVADAYGNLAAVDAATATVTGTATYDQTADPEGITEDAGNFYIAYQESQSGLNEVAVVAVVDSTGTVTDTIDTGLCQATVWLPILPSTRST